MRIVPKFKEAIMTTTKEKKKIFPRHYRTRQIQELLEYFHQRPGKHVSAKELCEFFSQKKEKPISPSTIYRLLTRLCEAGTLTRYVIEETKSACYAYIPETQHSAEERCFHGICEACGRVLHLHCRGVENLDHHLLEAHGFSLDPHRTVFYGLCQECRQQKTHQEPQQNIQRKVY